MAAGYLLRAITTTLKKNLTLFVISLIPSQNYFSFQQIHVCLNVLGTVNFSGNICLFTLWFNIKVNNLLVVLGLSL